LLAARTANLYVTGQEKIDRDVSSTGAYRDTACFARMSLAVDEWCMGALSSSYIREFSVLSILLESASC